MNNTLITTLLDIYMYTPKSYVKANPNNGVYVM